MHDGATPRGGSPPVLPHTSGDGRRPGIAHVFDGNERRLRSGRGGGRDDGSSRYGCLRTASARIGSATVKLRVEAYRTTGHSVGTLEGTRMSVFHKTMVWLGLVDDDEYYAEDEYYVDEYGEPVTPAPRAPARAAAT